MRPKKILIPALIFIVLLGLAVLVKLNPPQTEMNGQPAAREMNVDVISIQPREFQLTLHSYGTVSPRTQSELVSQVAGKIVNISPDFRSGGFFERGDVLVEIDDRDYQASLNSARASLVEARQLLVQEEAQVSQAREDWTRLGNGGTPPTLVSREPQLKAAQAKVLAAQAVLDTAEANLERTRIVAPYAGRVLEQKVDIGQVVSANATLASLYAIDTIEVRLPLKNRDLAYIDLPETLRVDGEPEPARPSVVLVSELGQKERWHGYIVRTEGAIDAASQQLYVIAQIDDPYGKAAIGRQPLKIGQYVTAEIAGRRMSNALVIPNAAIYQGSFVYVVDEGKLYRRDIEIAWQDAEVALIARGLAEGNQLVVSPVGQVASGTLARATLVNTAENDSSAEISQ